MILYNVSYSTLWNTQIGCIGLAKSPLLTSITQALAPIFWCVALALLRAKKVRGYEAIGDSDSSDDEAGNDPVLIKNAAFEDGEAPSE